MSPHEIISENIHCINSVNSSSTCNYTQGDLTQVFSTFPNPRVNLDFHMKMDPGHGCQMIGKLK